MILKIAMSQCCRIVGKGGGNVLEVQIYISTEKFLLLRVTKDLKTLFTTDEALSFMGGRMVQ